MAVNTKNMINNGCILNRQKLSEAGKLGAKVRWDKHKETKKRIEELKV